MRDNDGLLGPRLAAWGRPPGERPFVLGHRGARHAAPENTLAAFELARREGADGIELDVRLDGSGRVIVLHDPTLTRVTSNAETRHTEDIPSTELSRLNVGAGERVPLLSEVLAWAHEYQQRVNVELKSDVKNRKLLLTEVARVVRSSPQPALIFSSFHPYFVWWLARHLPDLPRAWLVHEKQQVFKYAPGFGALGANAVHPQHTLVTAQRVQRTHAEHALLNVWTVNEAARARTLAGFGVDAIITDVPGKILSALEGPNAQQGWGDAPSAADLG